MNNSTAFFQWILFAPFASLAMMGPDSANVCTRIDTIRESIEKITNKHCSDVNVEDLDMIVQLTLTQNEYHLLQDHDLAGLESLEQIIMTEISETSFNNEETVQVATVKPPLPQCTVDASSKGCWMKIQGNRDCYVWSPGPVANETAKWSGPCENGKGEGHGTLEWLRPDPNTQEAYVWITTVGVLLEGLPYGYWHFYYSDGLSLLVEFLSGGRLLSSKPLPP